MWLVNACTGVVQIMGYAMRLVMISVVVIAGLSGSALAQNNIDQSPGDTTTTGATKQEAPVGHRQPKPKDLPADVLQREETSPPNNKKLENTLIICRGC